MLPVLESLSVRSLSSCSVSYSPNDLLNMTSVTQHWCSLNQPFWCSGYYLWELNPFTEWEFSSLGEVGLLWFPFFFNCFACIQSSTTYFHFWWMHDARRLWLKLNEEQPINDWGEPAPSHRWTLWVWEITSKSLYSLIWDFFGILRQWQI